MPRQPVKHYTSAASHEPSCKNIHTGKRCNVPQYGRAQNLSWSPSWRQWLCRVYTVPLLLLLLPLAFPPCGCISPSTPPGAAVRRHDDEDDGDALCRSVSAPTVRVALDCLLSRARPGHDWNISLIMHDVHGTHSICAAMFAASPLGYLRTLLQQSLMIIAPVCL